MIYRNAILLVVLQACHTSSVSLKEAQRLRVFENKVLRKVFGLNPEEVTGD
jgi:hypothetical protein